MNKVENKSYLSQQTERIEEKLKEAADKLSALPEIIKPINAKPLRDLQRFFNQFVNLPLEADVLYLMFFLSNYIDDVFYNMLGDAYDENLVEARKDLFEKIGKLLKKLSNHFKERNFRECYQIYVKLVNAYMEKINFLNRKGVR